MSLSKRYGFWAVKLHAKTAQSAAAVHVDGIISQGISPNLRTSLLRGDSAVYNTFGSLVAGAPGANFATNDVKALLDACGVTGMLIDTDGSHPGVVLYWQKYAEGGTRDILASGTHMSSTFGNGILVPVSVNLPHQGAASVSASLLGRSTDGSTSPVAWSETASLDAGIYPSQAVQWGLGPVDLNGTDVEGVLNASIGFGLQPYAESGDDDVYPTTTGLVVIQPAVRLTTRHVDITSVLTEHGLGYSASQVILYAKKRTEGGTFVADGTAEHIKFTMGKCRVEPGPVSGDPATREVVITPWYTAGGSPVTPISVNTASAIT